MSNGLAELRARQIVQTMRSLKNCVLSFTRQAELLDGLSQNVDSRMLMQEANNLLKKLMAARLDFQDADGKVSSVKRSLSPAVPPSGGIPPAALWGNEMRAASKQFIEAVHGAEKAIQRLYQTSEAGMKSVTQTSTGDPTGIFDIVMNFVDLLGRVVERNRRT